MFGVINIHKPPGCTSHDVVAQLRRIFGLKKIGHLGTLDPMAEGVLPLCVGQATRLIEYFPSGKRYTAEITLGIETTTLDREGEETARRDCSGLNLSPETLELVLDRFRGRITQQVPLHSAVHVGGKKLYKLAQQGVQAEAVELPTREVVIESLELLKIDTHQPAHPVLHLNVQCSSGTYIRSLARDIGQALGCGAHLSALLRTRHGRFDLQDSVTLEALKAIERPQDYLQSPLKFLDVPVLLLQSDEAAQLLRNGMPIDPAQTRFQCTQTDEHPVRIQPNRPYIALYEDQLIGVLEFSRYKLRPVKIFPLPLIEVSGAPEAQKAH